MAAPVDAARVTYNGSTETTSHPVTLPGSISAGDCLLAIVRIPGAGSNTIVGPAGWTQMIQGSPDSDNDTTGIYFRVCDGTEGATATFLLGGNDRMAAIVWRITGAAGASVSPTAAVGTTTQPNSPSYTLPSTRDTLWLSLGGASDILTLGSGPSGYSNATIISHTGGPQTFGWVSTVFGASLQVTSDLTEDPGAWTLTGNPGSWAAYTVAVYEVAEPLRVSHESVETVVLPTNTQARVSHESAEVIIQPTDAQARISHESVEAVVRPTDSSARISEYSVEAVIEIIDPRARISHYSVEVIYRNPRELISVFIID